METNQSDLNPEARGVIVAFQGEIGAGKSTAAAFLRSSLGFAAVSFATPLRALARRVTLDGRIDKARDRKLLQILGSYYRDIDPDFFVRPFAAAVEPLLAGGYNVVVDDCRDPRELAYVRRHRSLVYWIRADEAVVNERLSLRDGTVARGIVNHASEAAITESDCDAVLDNGGGLPDLTAALSSRLRLAANIRNGGLRVAI